MKIEIRHFFNLLNAHYDKDEERVKEVCRTVAKELDEELQQYLLAQIEDVPTFVPM